MASRKDAKALREDWLSSVKTVRAELVEARFFSTAKKELPFDKLRANGMQVYGIGKSRCAAGASKLASWLCVSPKPLNVFA